MTQRLTTYCRRGNEGHNLPSANDATSDKTVESVIAPTPVRTRAWARLERDLPAATIDAMTEVVPLSELLERGPTILAGQVRGRWVVDPAA